MKIITPVKNMNYVNVYHRTEGVCSTLPYALLTECGFNNIGAHKANVPTDISNTVVIYGRDLTVKPRKQLVIDKNVLVLSGAELDGALTIRSDSEEDLEEYDVINIIWRKYLIGSYDTKENSLLLCDVTHNTINKLTTILEYIVEFNKKNNIKRRFKPYHSNSNSRIKIGMDPEFALMDNNKKFIHANTYITDPSAKSKVGLDGAPSIGELRPDPACSPKVLTKNISKLYAELSKKIKGNNILVYTGSGRDIGKSLGGHIHIGGMQHTAELLTMLDDFIGRPLKNLKFGDRGSYGDYSAFEVKPYGFEYRTPPSFIGNKKLTEGVLAVALCVAKTYRKKDSISYNDVPSKEDYANLVGIEKYKDTVDYFIEFTNNKANTLSEYDTLAAWKIKVPK